MISVITMAIAAALIAFDRWLDYCKFKFDVQNGY